MTKSKAEITISKPQIPENLENCVWQYKSATFGN
jgi:hypothetical protein